jgi:hypothetical protein
MHQTPVDGRALPAFGSGAAGQAVFYRETVTVGPFGLFFTNKNDEMTLPGHSHFAELTLTYAHEPRGRGFPAFEGTYRDVDQRLRALTAAPFRNATNEEVARRLFQGFAAFMTPEIARWGGRYRLVALELAVRGVHDKIGHAEGFTRYRVHATDTPILPESAERPEGTD